MIRAAIYARYSAAIQTEQSIEGQLRDCYKVAENLGYTVVKEYIDRALTGKNDNRPLFRKMINDSAFDSFDVVITWKMDRFARNRTDSALYKKMLKDNGVKVVYAAENIPEGNEGVILESVLEGMAEYFSLDLAQKVSRGKKESVLKGKYVGGSIPFGYKTDTHKNFVIDETTAPIIRKIFQDYISGVSVADISRNLNESNIYTKVGETWNRQKIGHILRNKKYAGIYESYGVKSEVPIPQIIDDETFKKTKALLAKHSKEGGRNKAKNLYLLSSKVRCGECGTPMSGNYAKISKKNPTKIFYYTCNAKRERRGCTTKSMNRDLLEKIVLENTLNTILQDEFIEEIANKIIEINESEDDSTSLINVYESELNEITSKIENIMKAIEEGVASKRMTDRISELEAREAQLKQQITNKKAHKNQTTITKEQIIFWLSSFKDGDINSIEFCKNLIKYFIEKVVVSREKVEIYYNYVEKDNFKMIPLNFEQNSLNSESRVLIELSEYKEISISKNTLCLHVARTYKKAKKYFTYKL